MRTQIQAALFSALFGLGIAAAAPLQAQDQAPPPPPDNQAPNNQAAPPQNGHGARPMDPNRQVQMLTKRLNLSSDQASKVRSVLENRAQQVDALRSDNSLSREDRGAKMRSIREDTDNQIRALLSDKQKKGYDDLQQEMRERQRQRREQQQNQNQNQ